MFLSLISTGARYKFIIMSDLSSYNSYFLLFTNLSYRLLFRAPDQTNHLYAGPEAEERTIKNTFLEKYQMNSSGLREATVEIFSNPLADGSPRVIIKLYSFIMVRSGHTQSCQAEGGSGGRRGEDYTGWAS